MEPKTYKITQKIKNKFCMLGSFLIFGSALGLLLCISNIYSILFTIIIFLLSTVGMLIGFFYLFSIKISSLQISESGMVFTYPFGVIESQWDKITKADVNSQVFRLHFLKEPHKRTNIINSLFFYKDNEIPIDLFVENWQNESNWDEDPLLLTLSKEFQWSKQEKQ